MLRGIRRDGRGVARRAAKWLGLVAGVVALGVALAQDPGGAAGGGQAPPTQPGQAPPTQPGQTPPPTDPGQAPPTQPADAQPTTPPSVTQVAGEEATEVQKLPLFGYDYFEQARVAIRARLEAIANQTQAPVAPATSVVPPNVFISAPDRYQLGPGDTFTARVSTPVREPRDYNLRVDDRGTVLVPEGGQRLVVRGMTLRQAEAAIQNRMREVVRGADVVLTLDELRTISVAIVGESFAPGNYEVPAVTTLFNAIYYTGGPTDRGSLRRIQLRRAAGRTETFDFYTFLLEGDNSADVPLQPGDVVFIPPAESRVQVRGEVYRPAVYEIRAGETLRTVLGFAGGVKPSGVAQRVSVESFRPGQERRLIDVDVTDPSDAMAVEDPMLFDGDVVDVLSVRRVVTNAVTLVGPVDQPGTYAVTPGMTVADLIELSRGLLPDASRRADIQRLMPDSSRQLIRVDLTAALTRDPNANPTLEPNDQVRVYTINELAGFDERTVIVEGAVRRPGTFTRAEGMNVLDVILQAGGLLPEAALESAFIQRENPDGTPGPLVRVDIRQALAGNPIHNVLLENRDVLRVFTVREATFVPSESVEVVGAVQRPGTFRRGEGMTVKDLLDQAGGPLPSAFMERAFLQRKNLDGTVGPLLTLDLNRVMTEDPEHNVPVNPLDTLNVYTKEQAEFRPAQTVRVEGGVQRPGTYPAAEGMTLEDVIALAGGLRPDAAGYAEVSAAYQLAGTPPTRVDFTGDVGSWALPSVGLNAGDFVSIPRRSDIITAPQLVTILGAVTNPGTYAISKRGERFSDLIDRVGGLDANAFPEGAEFIRDPQFLTSDAQERLQPRIVQVLSAVASDQYKRAQALLDMDRLRIISSGGKSIGANSGLAGAAQPAGQPIEVGPSLDQALAKALSSEGVTAARLLTEKELLPAGTLNVSLESALRRPGGREDIELMDGDVIFIPERPTTVAVTGAVVVPSSVLFEGGKPIEYYLQRAGGLTFDADRENVLIIRATGELLRYRRGTRIFLGDTILVPTKVQAVRFREDKSFIDSLSTGITTAATTLAIIRLLGGN